MTVFSPKELEAGSQGHYWDPLRYDRSYRSRRNDVDFYVEELANVRTPILEIGTGTGRIALPLARDGRKVVGIEPMPPMLAQFQSRLEREPSEVRKRITLHQADIFTLDLGQKFERIIAPFNVFQHLYTQPQIALALGNCLKHLKPNGQLIFDVLLPDLKCLLRDPRKRFPVRPLKDPITKEVHDYFEQFDYDPASQVMMVTSIFKNRNTGQVTIRPLAHRQFFPEELRALLLLHGFEIRNFWGDFDRSKVDWDSPSQIIIATPSRGASARSRKPKQQ